MDKLALTEACRAAAAAKDTETGQRNAVAAVLARLGCADAPDVEDVGDGWRRYSWQLDGCTVQLFTGHDCEPDVEIAPAQPGRRNPVVAGAPQGSAQNETRELILKRRGYNEDRPKWQYVMWMIPHVMAARGVNTWNDEEEEAETPLGCGYFGCAFGLKTNANWVLKATGDPSDAAAWAAVLAAGQVEGVAHVRTVFAFPKRMTAPDRYDVIRTVVTPPGYTVYGVVTERLTELPYKAQTIVNSILRAPWEDEREQRIERYGARSDVDQDIYANLYAIHNAMVWMNANLHVTVYDLHGGNIMQDAQGNWKITDLGVSVAPKVKIPKLEEVDFGAVLSRQAATQPVQNPRLPAQRTRRERIRTAAKLGEHGRKWYQGAEREIRTVAKAWGVDPVYVAVAVAATSPATPVISSPRMARGGGSGSNIGKARKVVKAFAQHGLGAAALHPATPGLSRLRAFEACEASPDVCLTVAFPSPDSVKTHAFVRNILGDPDAVTVDSLVARTVAGKTIAVTEARYREIAEDIRAVAKQLGWPPREVMAAVWTAAGGTGELALATTAERERVARR